MVTDIRPVQVSAPYRRLFFGNTVAQLGQQMTNVAVAVQVYALTQSSFYVGLVGVFALVPLVALGLYGGAVSDAVDRRTVALVASAGLWVVSIALAVQAFLGNGSVWVLYACIAVQSAFYAVNNPARSAMVPRLLDKELLPAAAALNMASFNLGFTFGPMIGALAIKWQGFGAAYTIDVLTFSAAYYALVRMPRMPPLANVPRPGLRAVVDGLSFLRRSPNLRMTFVADLCAMVLAQPRALFPALAYKVYAGGAGVVGVLQAAPAAGAVIAFLLSGWVSKVRLQGLAIVIAVVAYGAAVGGVGLTDVLWIGVVFLAFSGAADMVSAAYRSTILQVAAPDQMRGRLQGVFIVVVAGGPRAGDFLAGSVASAVGERLALVLGGLACIVGVLTAAALQRGFVRYDAHHPTP
ncbi:MAG: MFS transporter [Nocardioidaceae bacterium]|nr:MFS transporter [Nocardioidaceae bacterium]NUS51900.1 MFS transporter [Nocardioidaceae bacterium]